MCCDTFVICLVAFELLWYLFQNQAIVGIQSAFSKREIASDEQHMTEPPTKKPKLRPVHTFPYIHISQARNKPEVSKTDRFLTFYHFFHLIMSMKLMLFSFI